MKFLVEDRVRNLGIKVIGLKIENVDNSNFSYEFDNWRREEICKLIAFYQEYDIKSDEVIEGFYELHDKVGISRRKNLPASENLIKLLMRRKDLVKINKVVDIYNIISIKTRLCLGAHDIDKISGDVILKMTTGSEKFLPLGANDLKDVSPEVYSFVDGDNDIICWLDIRQATKTKVEESSKNILYFIIGNEENTYAELEKVAQEIIATTTRFCGGSGTILKEGVRINEED